MKKQYLAGLAIMGMMALSNPAHAALVVAGTVDSGPYAGAQVINDTDRNITWLDYTKSYDTWQNQVNWASDLSVTVNGATYDNWRLPSTVDDAGNFSYDGSTSYGYNNTTSEMGHLFYTELGNKGYYDTNGNPQSGYGLTNTGAFKNLVSYWYWSGTEYAADPNYAWSFATDGEGSQDAAGKVNVAYALAVLPGQIQSVPAPASMLLIGSGLAGLVGLARKKRAH